MKKINLFLLIVVICLYIKNNHSEGKPVIKPIKNVEFNKIIKKTNSEPNLEIEQKFQNLVENKSCLSSECIFDLLSLAVELDFDYIEFLSNHYGKENLMKIEITTNIVYYSLTLYEENYCKETFLSNYFEDYEEQNTSYSTEFEQSIAISEEEVYFDQKLINVYDLSIYNEKCKPHNINFLSEHISQRMICNDICEN